MTDIKLKAAAELELRKRLKKKLSSFDSFLRIQHPTLEWDLIHLVYMRKYLERIIARETMKIMFFLPPQHGKSTQNTVGFGAYYLLKNPMKNIILGAYNSDFASDFSIEIRNIVSKHMDLSINKASRWKIKGKGGLRSGGINSGITGFPANLVIIDDPVKSWEDAFSKVKREEAWKWWNSVIKMRMRVTTSCIFTMTRWHPDDLAGRILEAEDDWIVIRIPGLAEENDPLGRKVGEALWPSEFPDHFLLEKKKVDPGSFEALIQQNPVAAEGAIIKRAEIQYYEGDPGRYDYILQSWDTAFKDKEQNDYSALTTWGCIDNKIYLIDAFRGKLEYPDLKITFEQYAAKWKPNIIIIEDKASGQSIFQDLRRTSQYPLFTQVPNGDKVMRCHTIKDKIRAGLVLFPEKKEWMVDYINELCSFPSAKHDDWVDSTTQALIYLNNKYSAPIKDYRRLGQKIKFMG